MFLFRKWPFYPDRSERLSEIHHIFFHPISSNLHLQILQTDFHTFPYGISWKNLIKDQSSSPLAIILLFLITFHLDDMLILLTVIWCWSFLGLKYAFLQLQNDHNTVRFPKISPSTYKPLKPVTQKTPHLMAPPNISPRGLVRENRALKYKEKVVNFLPTIS